MKTFGHLVTLLSIFLLPITALAQSTVEGSVIDDQGEAVSFANVMLLHPQDSSLIGGTVSNLEGHFIIEDVASRDYLLKTTMIGYQAQFSLISIGDTEMVDLGQVTMSEEAQELEEVVITAQKPLYEKEIDRTVVNVQSSSTSTGQSALEVIARSPGVNVNRQTNTISLQGKTGVMVMINGKTSRLPIDAVMQMLDGMSAANIDKIELITTPPAKYDAEGDAGIINIVMAENSDAGTNGNVGITGGYNKGETLGGNFNLNHRATKYNYFVDYSILYDRNQHTWINQRAIQDEGFERTVISDSKRDPQNTVQNFRTGVEYDLTDKTKIEVLATAYRRNWDMDALTENINTASPDSIIVTEMSLNEKNKWSSASGSVGLSHQLDSRQSISFDFDYLYYDNDNPSFYENTTSVSQITSEELIDVTKHTPINFKIAKFDYANQVRENLEIQAGVKSTFSRFTNNVSVRSFANNEWTSNNQLTSRSNLQEDILAGYISWNWQPLDDLTVNGGIRYEHTNSYLSSPEERGLIDREFGNFFPSFFVAKSLSEESKLQLSYAKRISRPTFNDMAPFVFFAGPNTFVAGNPGLRPAITDGIDLNYTFRQWWISLKYSHTNNSIGWLQPEIDPVTNQQIFRSRNLEYFNSWSMSTSLPLGITPWWEVQSDVSVHYQTFRTSQFENDFEEDVVSVNLNATNSFTLPNNYFIEVAGNFQSRSLFGIWQFDPMGQLNLAVKKKLPNDKGSVTLSVSDVLNTSLWRVSTEIPESNATARTKYDFSRRSINLTYSRKFGNKKLRSVNIDSGSSDERRRVN